MNTRTYSWSECEINVAGQLQVEVTGVEWNEEQEMEPVYGKGNDPLDIKEGNITRTGTLTLLQGGLEELLDRAPQGKLIKLKNTDIQIAFSGDDLLVQRYSLIGVRFTAQPMALRQNDKKMEVAIPFMYLQSRRV